MAAPLQAVIERFFEQCRQQNTSAGLSFESMSQDVEDTLRGNEFLSQYGYSPFPNYDINSLPLRRFDRSNFVGYYRYLDILTNRICQLAGTSVPIKELRRSLGEVMANACEHSRAKVDFFCCMQYSPTDKKISFTFSDDGVGIRKNVNRFTGQNLTDVEAIEWAIKNGNSTRQCQSDSQGTPGGLGLDIIRQFVAFNEGKLCVVSGQGFHSIVPDVVHDVLRTSLCGTTIHLEINTADTKPHRLRGWQNGTAKL